MNDLKFAIRQLLKNPGFTAVAVATLALGIGLNTAIFSVVHGVLLKPLPYPEAERLVTLWERSPKGGIDQERVSGPNYLDWRAENSVLADMAVSPAWDGADEFNLVLPDGTLKVRGSYTSSSLFTTLGTRPLFGRTLLPEEDLKEGNRAVVLSHGLWHRQFGGDSNVLGQTLTLDTYGRRDYTIVGVMPSGFGLPGRNELWLPLGWMDVDLDSRRDAHWHNVIARLKPGVTVTRAQAQLSGIQARIKQAHPGMSIGSEVAVVPLVEQALGRNLHLGLLLLWGVVAGVLLIACANLANLLLARAASRRTEIAVRLALGAGRGRVLRQLLTESVLLASLGGGAGILVGAWGVRLFVLWGPPDIPRLSEVSLDMPVLAFVLLVSLLTGMLFGLVPAWLGSRANPGSALQDGPRGASSGTSAGRVRNLLVIGEVAVSLVMLTCAGLMLQSLAHMLRADRGFEPTRLVTVELDYSVSGFTTWVRPDGNRPQVSLQQLMERLRVLPGVRAVGAGSRLPRRENVPPNEIVSILGKPDGKPEEMPRAHFTGISPGWVQALGLRLQHGRDFNETDTLEAPGVVIINESFARRYFPNQDPVGQYLKMGANRPPLGATNHWGLSEWSQVVGVVSDARTLHPQPQSSPEIYVPHWQWPMQNPTLLIRTIGETAPLSAVIRRETKAVAPNLPAPIIHAMTALISDAVARPRLQTVLLSLFGGVALALTALGLYGMVAWSVSQRTRELGIRMALGAQRGDLIRMVVRQGILLSAIGVGVGVPAALGLSRLMASQLYEIKATDPGTLGVVSVVLLVVALLAAWLPARRAAKVDPMEALRSE